jgi:hypothetical protein
MLVIRALKASLWSNSAPSISSANPGAINSAIGFWPMRPKFLKFASKASAKPAWRERMPA